VADVIPVADIREEKGGEGRERKRRKREDGNSRGLHSDNSQGHIKLRA
jgi:hypothetical protein